MAQLFSNNANSKLLSPISNSALSLQVAAGEGAMFPSITGGDYFLVTLSKVTSGIEHTIEIVKVTARSGDTMTIVRAQEGTTAAAYATDDRVSLRLTASTTTWIEGHKTNTSNPHSVTAAQVGAPSGSGTSTGTNTGDQTITLTGDATGSGTGSFAVTVAKINGVSLAGLATGILKNTTTTGAPSIAAAGTDYVAPVGSDGTVTRQMLKDCGQVYYDSTTTNALDYTNGSMQRWAPNTGAQTLSITNWPPTGNLGELFIQGVNLGAATITWPTINWIKSDGTMTTTFSSNGVTLQSSGTDFVYLWTRDAGTTIYGKVVR